MILHEEIFFFTTIDNKNLGVFIFGLTILFLVCNDWLGLSHKAKLQKKKKKHRWGTHFEILSIIKSYQELRNSDKCHISELIRKKTSDKTHHHHQNSFIHFYDN